MQHAHKLTHITDRSPIRHLLTGRRLALLVIATLLAGLGLSLSPMRVAHAMTINVAAGPDTSAAVNDYRRIQNAMNAAMPGDTIMLSGTFDFTAPFAAAAWALGNDNTAATVDDYEVLAPVGVNNVIITASSLGAATIQGPGDLAAVNLEGVFVFDGGPNQGWTISNIRFLDFDLSIGFFNGAGGSTAFNNTKIINNYIRIAQDLNTTVAPADVNQNIGIHFSFGSNQMISGNMIDFTGDGVSAGANFSTQVGMQSNTSGGNVYEGLQITNNILHVINAQSANPMVILGIWENAHAHTSNITVSGNQFINLAMANSPATNLQRGFRVTSHSSPATMVTYQNNIVQGANIGFQWLAGSDFSGNQPVKMISNNIFNNDTGVLIQSNGSAALSFNRIHQNTVGLNNSTMNAINAENNWWGCNFGPGVGGAGCAGTANGVTNPVSGGSTDSNPWLVLRLTAVPSVIFVGGTSTLTADLTFNSDNVDTHLMGNVPDGIPVGFMGNAFGTVAPPSTSTASGKANSTYTGTAPGTANVSTTVDAQTVMTPITVNPNPCTVTCPGNQTKSNDPNQCGAVVTYPAPTTTGTCGTVTCSPASGSFFPVGTTTVTCTSTAGPSCTFTVTVNDTQPPSITCPGNVNTAAPATCPFAGSTPVTFATPSTANGKVTDNCPFPPNYMAVCTPASGSPFPVGTTTVTCTATDNSGNTATCSFTVTVFSGCVQDDSDPSKVVLFNAKTGQYRFCCGGIVYTGTGTVTIKGCLITITHNATDRRVQISTDGNTGNASLQSPPGTTRCTIQDRNVRNNGCVCQ